MERGADINQKTQKGVPTLYLAAIYYDRSVVNLLLRKGVNINERSIDGRTALHWAVSSCYPEIIPTLIENGTDLNILDRPGGTPLTRACKFHIQRTLVQELTKSKFEGQIVCPVNIEFINRNNNLQKIFEDSLIELKRLKDLKFYKGYTLYDILKMRKYRIKLANLMRNENLVKAFTVCRNRELFRFLGDELDDVFKTSLNRTRNLQTVENNINSIFKNYKYTLPNIAVQKIAYFVNEDLFYE